MAFFLLFKSIFENKKLPILIQPGAWLETFLFLEDNSSNLDVGHERGIFKSLSCPASYTIFTLVQIAGHETKLTVFNEVSSSSYLR